MTIQSFHEIMELFVYELRAVSDLHNLGSCRRCNGPFLGCRCPSEPSQPLLGSGKILGVEGIIWMESGRLLPLDTTSYE